MASTSQPECVASTGSDFCVPLSVSRPSRPINPFRKDHVNFFSALKISGDDSTVIAQTADQSLHTFLLPVNDDSSSGSGPLPLQPYATHPSPSNIQSFALYPHFSLSNPSTTVALTSSSNTPISLLNALDYTCVHAKYPLLDHRTESHLPANSLLFLPSGAHFAAGTLRRLAIFDLSQCGGEPLRTHNFGRNRGNASKISTGAVSALAISAAENLLAVGTTQGEFGIFEHGGLGECSGVVKREGREPGTKVGRGYTDLEWSGCGKYLITAERTSDVIEVYDVRGTGRVVAKLEGRKAETGQRLGIAVVNEGEGFTVWAGGMDGLVRGWRNPAKRGHIDGEGMGPDLELGLHGGWYIPVDREGSKDNFADVVAAPVSSLAWDSTASRLVTCSGTMVFEGYDDSDTSSDSDDNSTTSSEDDDDTKRASTGGKRKLPDNSLKVWRMT